MYTILISDSNELITSKRERIMQRSKLVDTLHFLADQTYKGIDMSTYTVLLEYILPVSKEYHSEILTLSDELYKNFLEYKLPFDTNLTKEAGDIELQISFIKVDLDENGVSTQCVRKTSSTTITIIPISAWSDIIPDSSLSCLDQRIIKTDAMIKALEDMNLQISNNQIIDDLLLENDHLRLSSNGEPIGEGVHILVSNDDGEIDGVSDGVIDLDNADLSNPDDDSDLDDSDDDDNPDNSDSDDSDDDNGFIEL